MLPAKKSLGQNFLAAVPVARKIVSALAPASGDLIFEIGPGRGALTEPLAESGAAIVAYEIDEGLVAYLREKYAGRGNIEIHHADIRAVDLDAEAEQRGRDSYKLAGNIPYHLTSTILINLAGLRRCDSAVLMVQREVGERILASPGDRACGILSIFLQSYCIIDKVLKVRPGSFTPPPKVESVVLGFRPRTPGIGPPNREAFLQLLKGCFSHRRKKLRNALGDHLGLETANDWKRLSELSGVDLRLRPEALTLDGWFRLFEASRRLKGL